MSEVFSVRLDDGLANQIKALEKSTEWLKEAIIQKAMSEIPMVEMNDYLEKYLVDKNVDYWSVNAIEIISSDNLILHDGIYTFKNTMSMKFEDIEPNLLEIFIEDTKALKRQFDEKKIGDHFGQWLKVCLMSSNHYNLLYNFRRDKLYGLMPEELEEVYFLYSCADCDEERVFEENFKLRGKDFDEIKKFFIRLGLVYLGYYRSKRFKYTYWRVPEISHRLMKELYDRNKSYIHRKIHQSISKEDIVALSRIVDFNEGYDVDGSRFYPRYVEQYQDPILNSYDKEIRDFVSRSIIKLIPHQGASRIKSQPNTRSYVINPIAIEAVNQRIAEFFIS